MTFFSVPSNLLALAAVVVLVLFVIRPRIGSIAMALSLASIAVVTLSPLGNALLTPLEQRFPQWVFPEKGLEGIIVLGGSYDYVRHAYLSTIILEDDTEPLAVMVDLARRYPEAKIIVTGGSAFEHGVSESSIMKEYFVSFGIAPEYRDRRPITVHCAKRTVYSRLAPSVAIVALVARGLWPSDAPCGGSLPEPASTCSLFPSICAPMDGARCGRLIVQVLKIYES